MPGDLFTNAQPIIAPSTSTTKGNIPILVEGLEKYAAIKAAMTALETELNVAKGVLNGYIIEHFAQEGVRLGSKPENFKGYEKETVASMQGRKRTSTSSLSDIEMALLSENGIPFETVHNVTETFIFNPERLDWLTKNSKKVSQALSKLGAPIDLIQKQVATPKYIVTDETIAAVFKKKLELVRQLLPIVITPAVRPSETPLDKAWALIRHIFAAKKKAKND